MPKPDPRGKVETVAVRPTMGDDLGHSTEQETVDIARPAEIENSGYAAHFFQPCEAE
jgi:hypothetical protein